MVRRAPLQGILLGGTAGAVHSPLTTAVAIVPTPTTPRRTAACAGTPELLLLEAEVAADAMAVVVVVDLLLKPH